MQKEALKRAFLCTVLKKPRRFSLYERRTKLLEQEEERRFGVQAALFFSVFAFLAVFLVRALMHASMQEGIPY